MINQIQPPTVPKAGPVQPPMMYVQEQLTWEYKRIDRPLEPEQLLDEAELNALGAEGWQLVASVTAKSVVCTYLQRPKR